MATLLQREASAHAKAAIRHNDEARRLDAERESFYAVQRATLAAEAEAEHARQAAVALSRSADSLANDMSPGTPTFAIRVALDSLKDRVSGVEQALAALTSRIDAMTAATATGLRTGRG